MTPHSTPGGGVPYFTPEERLAMGERKVANDKAFESWLSRGAEIKGGRPRIKAHKLDLICGCRIDELFMDHPVVEGPPKSTSLT